MRRKRTLILSAAAVVAAAGTAWIALPASASATTATFSKTADWGTGWQAEVKIANGDEALSSWKVEFDLPAGAQIGSFWEADLKSEGRHVTFTNRSWNGTVPADGTTTFGFVGSGGVPTNCLINGSPCTVSGSAPAPASSAPVTAAPTTSSPAPAQSSSSPAPAESTYPTAPADSGEVPPKSDVLPVKVTNNTGRNDNVYVYVLGTNLSTGKLGYVDANGAFTAWSGGAAVPVPAPDVAISGPAAGKTTTVKVPKNLSGRIYMSFGQKLDFRLTTDGLVQPAPWASGDPNFNILFDWTEFTLNDSGLWINSTQVDMFAVPQTVTVLDGTGSSSKTGELKSGGRQKVIDGVKANPAFAKSVVTRADGTVLRVLAPGKAASAGLMDANYLAPYINSAWSAYAAKTLTVTPFTDQPNTKFFGKTSGDVMNFTDTTGKTVASFTKPSTADVWDCAGALGAPNDLVVGPIARTLCAAMQRTTLGTLDTQPSGSASDFYKGDVTNVYAKVVHEQMADGKAYAFAFDDVQNQESLVHSGDPRQATIVLGAF